MRKLNTNQNRQNEKIIRSYYQQRARGNNAEALKIRQAHKDLFWPFSQSAYAIYHIHAQADFKTETDRTREQ